MGASGLEETRNGESELSMEEGRGEKAPRTPWEGRCAAGKHLLVDL